jgi:hypothetical protein
VIPVDMTSQMLTKNSTAATIVLLLAFFTSPPFRSVRRWLLTNHIAHRPLEFDAEQLKLTW